MKTTSLRAKSLMTSIEYLRAELLTCTTVAMRHCVQETLDATRARLKVELA